MMYKKFFVSLLVFILMVPLSPSFTFADLKFKWGPYLRLRYEYWRNLYDFDNGALDNRNFFRIKTSLWGQWDFNEDLGLYLRLTNENKPYTYYAPSISKLSGQADKKFHFDIHEAIIDNLYFDAKNIFDLPLDLRFGRQDLSPSAYGEGFLIADGGPRDGSRTNYFNAAKFTLKINDKNSLEFIALKNPRTDDILPIINRLDGEQGLNYSDEFGYILYHRFDKIEPLHLENYYIYKREGKDRTAQLPEKSTINTFGSFAKYPFVPWILRGQFAYQFGTYGYNDRQGFGGYVYLDRDFKEALWSPQLSVGYYYLSGNDRATSKYEGFNQLFSTYSWMSELYNLSYSDETGTGYWTNLQMWRLGLTANFNQKTKGMVEYNFLRANETQTGIHASFDNGRNRGHLSRCKVDYTINKNVTTYFMAEYFIPGDFYVDKSDEALFLRTELQIKF